MSDSCTMTHEKEQAAAESRSAGQGENNCSRRVESGASSIPGRNSVTHDIPEICLNEIVPSMQKSKDNSAIILLFLSINKRESPQEEYIASDGKGGTLRYNGMLTNDAPIQHLLDCARIDGHSEFSILPILTAEVAEKEEHNLGRLQRLVAAYCASYGLSESVCRYVPIVLPNDASPDALSTVFFQHVSKMAKGPGQDIYVDFTGGFRDISMLMVTITRYLEFSGRRLRKIVYVKYDGAKGPKPIIDIEGIYDQLNLINGTGSFLETGNPQELEKALPELPENSPEKELLDAIQAFSNAMSICGVSGIEENIIRMREKVAALELPREGEVLLKSEMLRFLGPTIQSQMKLDDIVTDQGNREYSVNYPVLISWCVENRLIQQAITLYTEKMPSWYFSTLFSRPQSSQEVSDVECFYQTVCTQPFTAYAEDFQKSLKDILSRCGGLDAVSARNTYADAILGAVRSSTYVKPYNALGRLLSFINSNYDESGYLKNDMPGNQDYSWAGKTVADLLNILTIAKKDKNPYLGSFLYGDAVQARRSSSEVKSYHAKAASLMMIRNRMFDGFSETHKKAIAYYLAIKLVRNQMNHASDELEDSFTKDLVAELKNHGINLSLRDDEDRFQLSYLEVMTLLEDAMQFNEALVRYYTRKE